MTAIVLIVALVLFWAPYPSPAQSVAQTPRIGMLAPAFGPHSPYFEPFRQGLRDLGDVEGQSIALEYRSTERKDERLPALAAELVRLKVDIIVANGTPETRAAQHASGTIPIVFLGVPDPVGGSVHMTQDTCGKQFLPTSSARF